MTKLLNGKTLTPQGEKIVAAIEAGIKAMTRARWAEENAKASEFEDEGEWFAPEFAAAREATEGISWDFCGWNNTLEYITEGSGAIGGVALAVDERLTDMENEANYIIWSEAGDGINGRAMLMDEAKSAATGSQQNIAALRERIVFHPGKKGENGNDKRNHQTN